MEDNRINQQNTGQDQVLMAEKVNTENLLFGIIAGVIAAVIGAIIWACISAWTEYQIGWMAIGVGALVGFAVRFLGKGSSLKFGIIGAILSLFGCLMGNLLAVCIAASKEWNISLFEILSLLDFPTIIDIFTETFSPIDIVFYIIAVVAGFQFSFKKTVKAKTAL